MIDYNPIYSGEKGISVRAKLNKSFYDLTVGPEGVNEMWLRLNNLQYLRVSKVYTTFDDMMADRINPIRDDGYPLKEGELVSVLYDEDPSKRGFYRRTIDGYTFMYAFSVTSHDQLTEVRSISDADIPEGAKDLHITKELADKILSFVDTGVTGIYLRKDIADTAKEPITFEKGIVSHGDSELERVTIKSFVRSPVYTPGFLGEGFNLRKDAGGNWNLDIDNLLVRKNMDVFQIIINKIRHVGGAYIFSPASAEVKTVEEFPTYYRCFVKEPDNNHFVKFDQAICQTFTGRDIKRYWRLVVNVAADKSYFDLSKDDCEAGSKAPKEGDEIVQLGNRTEYARQSAIYMSSYGANGPYQQFLTGINSYSLADKIKIQLSAEDTFFKANRFEIESSSGKVYRVPIDKGAWVAGTYDYYDRVSHNGSLWLCIAQPSTDEEPVQGSFTWQEQVAKGETKTAIRVEKFNTPGYEFYREGHEYEHTLGIKIFDGEEDITDTINIARFVWIRISENEAGDLVWNDLHTNSGASVDINLTDLAGDTSFIVQFWDASKETLLRTTKF